MAVAGFGLCQMPQSLVRASVERNELVVVLPDRCSAIPVQRSLARNPHHAPRGPYRGGRTRPARRRGSTVARGATANWSWFKISWRRAPNVSNGSRQTTGSLPSHPSRARKQALTIQAVPVRISSRSGGHFLCPFSHCAVQSHQRL